MSYGSTSIPLAYTTPGFPALYWPIGSEPGVPQYLYHLYDIWRYTLFWSLITIVSAHFIVATWAVLMQLVSAHHRRTYLASPIGQRLSAKNRKLLGENPYRETLTWVWLIPGFYLFIGGVEALLAGSLVGVVLGAVYDAGNFRMSTWTPLFWGIINVLVLVVSSFRIQGGL